MKEPEMQQIAAWISQALANPADTAALHAIRADVAALNTRFPLP
jgi:glycine hydroxymethyltransferase